MTTKKPSLTVGIPAYNEQANIGKLIKSLLRQKQSNFVMEKIIIRTDGCTDATAETVEKFKSKKIQLIIGKKRIGKARGENIIFKLASSNYVTILDADLSIKDDYFLARTIEQMKINGYDLAGIKFTPLEPLTFYEKAVHFGYMVKFDAFVNRLGGANWYTCCGAARSFSKQLYKKISFPASPAEDMFSYLYCKAHGFKYGYIDDCSVFIRLPGNFYDHLKQSVRFQTSVARLWTQKNSRFINMLEKFPNGTYLRSFLNHAMKSPILATTYASSIVAFLLIAKLRPHKYQQSIWEIAETTRIII